MFSIYSIQDAFHCLYVASHMTSVIEAAFHTSVAREHNLVWSEEKIYLWVWVAICGVDNAVTHMPKGHPALTYGSLFEVPTAWRYSVNGLFPLIFQGISKAIFSILGIHCSNCNAGNGVHNRRMYGNRFFRTTPSFERTGRYVCRYKQAVWLSAIQSDSTREFPENLQAFQLYSTR